MDVVLAEEKPAVAKYRTKIVKDPFKVSLDEKIAVLLEADRLMRKNPAIKVAEGAMSFWQTDKFFLSTEGADIDQTIIESGAGLTATAVGNGDVQRRSFPASWGDTATRGYEFVEGLKLVENAEKTADEAAALLKAPECPSGEMDLIIMGSQLALQVHESCGHPTELDRVFGTEASFAGTSFLTVEKMGNFAYGSKQVSIYPDATAEGGLGTFGFDDEGVPAQRTPVVKEGRFVGYLTSRETASRLNMRSNACMRADGWNRIPLDPDDQHQPGAGQLGLRRADQGHQGRHHGRLQQELEHRRQAPELPVRHRDGLEDQERQDRGPDQERALHRHHPGVLGQLRCGLRQEVLAHLGSPQLRQGRADAGRPRRPRGCAGKVQKSEGRCRQC